jgi:predicted dehydrogenase
MPWNIGFLGAGPGVAALHLPTLGYLDGVFRVAHLADAGSGRARPLAEGIGARWSAGDAQVLADPDVDIVAVCSPPAEHPRQILQAIQAGKKAIFCEKPLALTRADAEEVIDACRFAGTLLLVGTNHLFDPAWGRAKHWLVALEGRVRAVSVTLSLPPNDRYHELVAEGGPFLPSRSGRPDLSEPDVARRVLHQLLTGLAVHDIPALRDLVPGVYSIEYARLLPPIGYAVGYRAGDVLVQLVMTMVPAGPDALWKMVVATSQDRLEVDFPPAFVHAGSAAARVRSGGGRWTEYRRDAEDGYVAEWRVLAELLDGGMPVEYDELLADALYAIDLADAAAAKLGEGL